MMITVSKTDSPISINLIASWERSENKIEGWTIDKAEQALGRYIKYLCLIAKYPNMPHAPTRDIDEMWHLHMLSPKAYYEDCDKLYGEILDHDGGFGKDEAELPALKKTFENTARLWEIEYGEAYALSDSGSDITKCWHDCQSRCWHACASIEVNAITH